MVDPILILAWPLSWSNFGTTWSTLVNFGQTWSTSVKSFQTSRNVPSAIFWKLLDAFELLSNQTWLNLTASFCMPIPKKILVVKIELWQLPLLCLALFGTKSVEQRTNDSIFAHSDFLDSRARSWTLWKIFLGLRVCCWTCWLSIGLHTGQKLKVGFKFFGTKHRGATCQKLISVFSQNFIFSYFCFLFLLSSLFAQISQSRSLFTLSFVPFFFWIVEMWFFFLSFFFWILFDLSTHLANS